jgi:hypothetical protein
MPRLTPLLVPLLAVSLTSLAADKSAPFEPVTIPLKAADGDLHSRDSRVFAVPVECAGVKAHFVWGCGGEMIVSEAFAKQARLAVKDDPELAPFVDPQGKPLFLGSAHAEISLGGRSVTSKTWVMRDGRTNKHPTGILGYDVARQFQWEIDPRKPSLTLRPPGTPLAKPPLATLHLKLDQQNFWVNVKIRNVNADVCLIPQSTDFQAAPDLQKRWDLAHSGLKVETNTYLGDVRTVTLNGKSGVHLAPDVYETDVLAILLEDNPNARSGIGQSLLNRHVYCVDPETQQMHLIEKAPIETARATTRPTGK